VKNYNVLKAKMTYTENEISTIAQEIITNATSKTLCFYGEMGAGKTTLIKALVKKIGNIETVNSPTFGIVNEYQFLPENKTDIFIQILDFKTRQIQLG